MAENPIDSLAHISLLMNVLHVVSKVIIVVIVVIHTQNDLNNLYKYTRLWCALKIINMYIARIAVIFVNMKRHTHTHTYKHVHWYVMRVRGKWITLAWHACMSNKNYLYNIFFPSFFISLDYILKYNVLCENRMHAIREHLQLQNYN